MTDAPNGQTANLWLRFEEGQGRSGKTERWRRIDEIIKAHFKGMILDGPRVAFRPFKTLILTERQKKSLRRTKEFRRFRGLASDSGETLYPNNECRAAGRGQVRVEIMANHPITADRAKFRATVDGDGAVIKAEVLDHAALDAEADRARAG